MEISNKNTILFDFYGTIALYGDMKEGNESTWKIIYDYMSSVDNSILSERFLEAWDRIFTRVLSKKDTTEETTFETKLSMLFKEFGVEVAGDRLKSIAVKCLENWHRYIHFPESVVSTLEKIKKRYKIGIVSNFDHPPYLREYIKGNKIDSLFDCIVISGELGISKPDPLIFQEAFKQIGSSPRECIFIGDSMKDDIEGSSGSGCYPILIDNADQHGEYRGTKIRELSDLLAKL